MLLKLFWRCRTSVDRQSRNLASIGSNFASILPCFHHFFFNPVDYCVCVFNSITFFNMCWLLHLWCFFADSITFFTVLIIAYVFFYSITFLNTCWLLRLCCFWFHHFFEPLLTTMGCMKSPNQETKGQFVCVFLQGGYLSWVHPFFYKKRGTVGGYLHRSDLFASKFILPWVAENCPFHTKFCIAFLLFWFHFPTPSNEKINGTINTMHKNAMKHRNNTNTIQ